MTHRIIWSIAAALSIATTGTAWSADHGEPPLVADRPASNMGDFYAFRSPTDQSQLVAVITFNPFVPPGTNSVPFSDSVEYVINIDNEAPEDPEDVRARIKVEARFDDGALRLDSDVAPSAVFAGLRDDPFIGGAPLNINALVVQLPLDAMIDANGSLFIWAQTRTNGLEGSFQDSAGMPVKLGQLLAIDPSIDPDEYNQTRPRDQIDEFGDLPGLPDVLTIDRTLPDGMANGNGRGLDDFRAGGIPNNVEFLAAFPFLAGPN